MEVSHGLSRPARAAQRSLRPKIEQLAALHRKGVLTGEEFSSKKADLLGRI